jgi:hypothetical protein
MQLSEFHSFSSGTPVSSSSNSCNTAPLKNAAYSQGVRGPWKSWKVLEFEKPKDWKILKLVQTLRVLEFLSSCADNT